MTRQVLRSFCIVLLAAAVSLALADDAPVFAPIGSAVDESAPPPDNQETSASSLPAPEPKSTFPDPQYYDPSNRRFDSGPSQGLGTYGAAVLQTINTITFAP